MGCSSYRKGNIIARNFDWYYTNLAEFVIRTPRTIYKHATLGMGGNSESLPYDVVTARTYNEHYKYVPYTMVDGINDAGLVMSANVVPVDGVNVTKHTNIGKPGMSIMRMMRYILDTHDNINDALTDIKTNFDIYSPHNEHYDEEFHFLIGDASGSTHLIEFIKQEGDEEGKTTIVTTDISNHPFITNFRLNGVEIGENMKPNWDTIEPLGMGVERFELIADNYLNLTQDTESFKQLGEKLKYTNLTGYTDEQGEEHNPWLTEFCGIYSDLTVQNAKTHPEVFGDIVERAKVVYANRSRDVGDTWHSEHVSIYDIGNRELHLIPQEDFNCEMTFSL